MRVDRYYAGQVVFFHRHEPALNAGAESLYLLIATKNGTTALHVSTDAAGLGYYLHAKPTRATSRKARSEENGSRSISIQ